MFTISSESGKLRDPFVDSRLIYAVEPPYVWILFFLMECWLESHKYGEPIGPTVNVYSLQRKQYTL